MGSNETGGKRSSRRALSRGALSLIFATDTSWTTAGAVRGHKKIESRSTTVVSEGRAVAGGVNEATPTRDLQ